MSGHLDPVARRRVSQARVARLATVRPDGTPHVIPITFAFAGSSIVTVVDDKPKSTRALQRLRNIEANPVVSILVDHYDDDWSRLWWVRGDGTARLVGEERDGDHRDAVAALVGKYSPYRDRRPRGPVIIVTVDRWRSWSAT